MKYCWEYTDDYLEYRSSLGLDIRNPGYYIKDFSRYLRNTYPNEIIITKEMVFPWCITRSNEKSYSFKTRMSNLRQFTIFVYSLGVCEFILDTSFTPKTERYVPYIFTDQELSDLFNIAIRISIQDPKSYKKLVISIIYRLIFYCGLRPNEGREIMISDINLNNQTIFIRKNKTHKERIIPISDDISEMIKDYTIINSAATPVTQKSRKISTYDLFPTTLASLGVTFNSDRLGLGTNLYTETSTLVENLGFKKFDKELTRHSNYYDKYLLYGKGKD